jgi:FkbM family methyltransferase
MKNKIKLSLSNFIAKKSFQPIFENLNALSLIGMNIGGGADAKNSGEINSLKYINKCLSHVNELTIFDVGANVGTYSILINEVFGDNAKIYSFEPSKKTFESLERNINNKPSITLHNFGFGNEDTKITLFGNSDEPGLASVYNRRLEHFHKNMNISEEIEIQKLDTFCSKHEIERIHFLKLDVEGHELKVLEGSARMLNLNKIDFIQFEFGGCNIDSRTFFQDFYYLLKDNFKIYRIVKNGLYPIKKYKEMYEIFTTTNFLAERQ